MIVAGFEKDVNSHFLEGMSIGYARSLGAGPAQCDKKIDISCRHL
jgi:hypothetical protein